MSRHLAYELNFWGAAGDLEPIKNISAVLVASFKCASLPFMLVQSRLAHLMLTKAGLRSAQQAPYLGSCFASMCSLTGLASTTRSLPIVATVAGTGQHVGQYAQPRLRLCRCTITYTATFSRIVLTGFSLRYLFLNATNYAGTSIKR